MPLEYTARAVAVGDSENGDKVLVVRTECGRTVKIFVSTKQADFAVKELNPVEMPCA